MEYTLNLHGPALHYEDARRGAFADDEALVTDARAGLTPSQMVERKLVALLKSNQLPMSRLQMAGPRRGLSS
jgi:hypothetical protein